MWSDKSRHNFLFVIQPINMNQSINIVSPWSLFALNMIEIFDFRASKKYILSLIRCESNVITENVIYMENIWLM